MRSPRKGDAASVRQQSRQRLRSAGQQRENAESEGKEDAGMSDKSGYVGRIKNGGTQVVKAPNQQTDAKKGVVHTGSDLRSK